MTEYIYTDMVYIMVNNFDYLMLQVSVPQWRGGCRHASTRSVVACQSVLYPPQPLLGLGSSQVKARSKP